MPRRPAFAESAEKPRVLVCASVEVPGSSAAGVRAEQLLLAFSGDLDIDALSLKGKNLTHIQRVGAARMLRVPVPEPHAGDGTPARNTFLERLAAFRRALLRQLDNDGYDVVVCLDLFAAAAALPSIGKARLVIEVSELPSVVYDGRFPVSATDADTRVEWELGERAALKAAALVVAPSRQAARALSDRTDPRLIRAFPRLVDTRVFCPPTVEVDLGETRTVTFIGGREGGGRGAVMLSALKLLGARTDDVRFLLVGTPSRADAALTDALQRRGMLDRCVLVDTATQADVHQALCAADVVVVPGDDGAWAIPHRALEAMACGRATVIAANDVACRDHVLPDQHAKVVPPDAPERIADAVVALLDDPVTRSRIARAGLRQSQRFDLGARGPELGAMLTEATGVTFTSKLPPLEEVTAPAPIARAVPATPLSTRTAVAVAPVAVLSSVSSLVEPMDPVPTLAPLATAAPPPLVDEDGHEGDGHEGFGHEGDGHEGDGHEGDGHEGDGHEGFGHEGFGHEGDDGVDGGKEAAEDIDHLDSPTIETGELPRAVLRSSRPFVPMSAVKGLSAEAATAAVGDVWAGDTMFDPGTIDGGSSPVPERVKGAMLNTDSGSAPAARPAVPPTTDSSRPDARRPAHLRTTGPSATSLRVGDTGLGGGDDDWGTDTIADASPLAEPTRLPSQDRGIITHPPKSFLVEHGVGDMTAEDDAEGSS